MMSAAGYTDVGNSNMMQDDNMQADDDYDDGLNECQQTDIDPKVQAESIKALRRAD